MKLLSRTSYILITSFLFVFFIGSIVFYIILKSATEKEIKRELSSRMQYIILEFKENPSTYDSLSIPGYVKVEKVEAGQCYSPVFKDTIFLDKSDSSYKQYKSLNAKIKINSDFYQVNIYKSLVESTELIERITLVATLIIIIFVLFIYLLNRFIFASVWSDFFTTVDKLKSFDVNRGGEIQFAPSDIAEFKLLNSTLNQMIGKIQKDYVNVKDFTGNISHEIQTPLAIIRLKCELLLQSSPLDNEQAALIRDIQATNSRLSKLNKTLVLFTKIENRQFPDKEEVSIDKLIKHHLENFTSIAKIRNILIKYDAPTDIQILADPMLIDVLVVNLLKNAVVHNIDEGEIFIEINEKELHISNTGEEADLSEKNIFDRYTNFNKGGGSLGLGLSLVKKICELYGYSIDYQYANKHHNFKVSFIDNINF